MVVFLLLVIIAILLFGSSVILGAIGAVLGIIAAAAAFVALCAWLGLDPGQVIPWAAALLFIGAIAGGLWENFTESGRKFKAARELHR